MTTKKIIQIDIHSYWHIGTGKGSGPSADALVAKSPNGLPVWPGKSVKGVFRDAFNQATELEFLKNDITSTKLEQLFGPQVTKVTDDPENKDVQIRFQQDKGAFLFSDGRLNVGEEYLALEKWAGSKGGKEYTPYFYKDVSNVKLQENGIAEQGALRAIQLTKPLRLFAEVEFVDQGGEIKAEEAFQLLEKTFPLVRLLGASRTRGLGRISVSYQ